LNDLFAGDSAKQIYHVILTMYMDEVRDHPCEIHGCKATCRYTAAIELTRARVRYDAFLSLQDFRDAIVGPVEAVGWDHSHHTMVMVTDGEGMAKRRLHIVDLNINQEALVQLTG
jgi:hypothetical protein